MPPSLRSSMACGCFVTSHKSLGHFKPMWWAGAWAASRLSAKLTPTASDRPDQSTGASGIPNENIRLSPRWLCHWRPSRPRPALCCSATSSVGSSCPALKRRISSVLVESIVGNASQVKPGRWGTTACQMASKGQRMGSMLSKGSLFQSFFLSFFFFFLSSLSLGASSVPRHFLAPHQHGYSANSFLVYLASMIRP